MGYWRPNRLPLHSSTKRNANTLDDYEEGTYTATITCATSGTVTLNATYDLCSYVKIGRLVTVHGYLAVSSVSSPAGFARISIPFACRATIGGADEYSVGGIQTSNVDFVGTFLNVKISGGASYLEIVGTTDAAAETREDANIFSANDELTFCITYEVA